MLLASAGDGSGTSSLILGKKADYCKTGKSAIPIVLVSTLKFNYDERVILGIYTKATGASWHRLVAR
jgi:hypothetical protein